MSIKQRKRKKATENEKGFWCEWWNEPEFEWWQEVGALNGFRNQCGSVGIPESVPQWLRICKEILVKNHRMSCNAPNANVKAFWTKDKVWIKDKIVISAWGDVSNKDSEKLLMWKTLPGNQRELTAEGGSQEQDSTPVHRSLEKDFHGTRKLNECQLTWI